VGKELDVDTTRKIGAPATSLVSFPLLLDREDLDGNEETLTRHR
jgi:hypothetical protein